MKIIMLAMIFYYFIVVICELAEMNDQVFQDDTCIYKLEYITRTYTYFTIILYLCLLTHD